MILYRYLDVDEMFINVKLVLLQIDKY